MALESSHSRSARFATRASSPTTCHGYHHQVQVPPFDGASHANILLRKAEKHSSNLRYAARSTHDRSPSTSATHHVGRQETSRSRSRSRSSDRIQQWTIHPAGITNMIKQCYTHEQLLSTLQETLPHLNALHASAATTHAAQLMSKVDQPLPLGIQQQQQQQQEHQHLQDHCTRQLMRLLLDLQWLHVHSFAARQAANSLWALAKLAQLSSEGRPTSVPLPAPSSALLQSLVARLEDCMLKAQPVQPQVRAEYNSVLLTS